MTAEHRSAPGSQPARTAPTRLPDWLTGPASLLYARGAANQAARFDAGRGVVRIDRPVLSVGNLSVGGTGKTPVVGWMVEQLRAMGRDPAVAMRGYRSQGGLSDEAQLHGERFEDLPVVARPDRLEGLFELFASERGQRVDTVVLDDGFQHRRIARSMDLVLVDATRDPFRDRLLPSGWLREPIGAISRATHIAITHAEAVAPAVLAALEAQLASSVGRPVDAVLKHHWSGLQLTEPDGVGRTEPVGWLQGRPVVAACAIGNPQPFLSAVGRATGAEAAARVYPDHHAMSEAVVRDLIRSLTDRGAQALVVTQKDWTKLAAVPASRWPCPVVRPVLELAFVRGEDFLRAEVARTASEHTPDDG